jgi:hypothetical protein
MAFTAYELIMDDGTMQHIVPFANIDDAIIGWGRAHAEVKASRLRSAMLRDVKDDERVVVLAEAAQE